jgi:hypothetical protein
MMLVMNVVVRPFCVEESMSPVEECIFNYKVRETA